MKRAETDHGAQRSAEARQYSEEKLVAQARTGDPSALEELLARHRNLVHGVVRRYAESFDEAEDLLQDTMLRAIAKFSQFRGDARFSTWLIAIAVHTAISLKRKTSKVRWLYLDDDQESYDGSLCRSLAASNPTPEQECIRKEMHVLLHAKVRRLHPRYRFILLAQDFDGVSIETAAGAIGITKSAAKSRLLRARKMVADAFDKHRGRKPSYVSREPGARLRGEERGQ